MYAAIEAALNAFLQAALPASSPDVAWPGVMYTPDTGKPYLSPQMSAYTRQPVSAGPDGVFLEQGTFTIAVKWPNGQGTPPATGLADDIVRMFPRATSIPLSAQPAIVVLGAQARPPIEDGAWLTVPVVVSWQTTDSDR